MKTATALSLNEAAKASGRGKSTIHKALNDGRLSATKAESGEWLIEPVELFRVFPANTNQDRSQVQQRTPESERGELGENIQNPAILQSQLKSQVEERERERNHYEKEIGRLENVIQDLGRRLDNESEERRKLTMMLTHQTETTPKTNNRRLAYLVAAFFVAALVCAIGYLYFDVQT
jgi:hypothetical protein